MFTNNVRNFHQKQKLKFAKLIICSENIQQRITESLRVSKLKSKNSTDTKSSQVVGACEMSLTFGKRQYFVKIIQCSDVNKFSEQKTIAEKNISIS